MTNLKYIYQHVANEYPCIVMFVDFDLSVVMCGDFEIDLRMSCDVDLLLIHICLFRSLFTHVW